MLGIEDFHPTFYTSANDLIANCGDKLRVLFGQQILSSWVLWNRRYDSWWSEWPIILVFKEHSLEICVDNDNQLSVSWGTIDVTKPLFPNSNGFGDALSWRQDALPGLVKVNGQRVKEILIVEYKRQITILRDNEEPWQVGKTFETDWLLIGMEFRFEQSYLSVWNALSGIEIDGDPLIGNDIRKTLL